MLARAVPVMSADKINGYLLFSLKIFDQLLFNHKIEDDREMLQVELQKN